jgi:hypothetical protein
LNPLAQAAHDYAAEGFAVFPLRVRDKPPLPGSTGKDAASADVETVVAWWSGKRSLPTKADWKGRAVIAGPKSNVAIATGAISGFWVFDIDGAEGEAALAALETRHGALPVTPEQQTGKGRQLLFRWDPARPVRNMSKRSRERIGPEVDVRGDGGYIVAPPSIHPSGRTYAWVEGRSPHELAFAAAPAWLMDLVSPVEAPAPAAQPSRPRPRVEGNATRYGEKALDGICADLRRQGAGGRNDAIFQAGCRVGSLCAGGEILSESYALEAVRNAARDMLASTGGKWTEAREEDTLRRGFETGQRDPASAPERRGPAPAGASRTPSPARPAAALAKAANAAAELWLEARSGWSKRASEWLLGRGLEPSATEALTLWRSHDHAPWGRGEHGPALLAPLIRYPAELNSLRAGVIEAVAILPLVPNCRSFAHAVGDHVGRVAPMGSLAGDSPLLVTTCVGDGWALGARAPMQGFTLRTVIAPALLTFAGGALGDRYGRVDPETPSADPAAPCWTLAGAPVVYLAVRRDLRGPALKVRQAGGGTTERQLQGEAAARFYGALAEQHWQAAEASEVRLLAPAPGRMGFNPGSER